MINQQHECQQWLFVKTVKLFIAQVFIKTLPNRIFMAVLFVLRVIALFGILLWGTNSDDSIGEGRNGSGGQSTVIIHQPAILFILWLCLVFTILLSLGIAYILYKFYNLTKRSTKRTQQQSYLFNIIQKTVIYCLVVYRIFLILPMIFVAFVAVQEQGQFGQQLQQQRQGQVTALVVSNLLLGLGLVYPLSGVGFWNKIGIRQNELAYCTVMNTQSLVFVFVPIIIILRVHAYSIYPYVSILLAILSVMTLYIYPLVSFNHNKLHTIASCSMVNVLFVMGLCVLVKAQISTFGRFVVVLLAVGVGVVAMWQLQQYRVRLLLCIKGVVDSNEDGNNNSNMNNYNNQNTNKANNNNSINNNMNHININTNQQQIPKINNNPQPITTNKLSWIDSQSYYQNLLYHLINWQYCQNDLLLHVIATLKYTSSNSSNGLYEDAQLITGNQPKVLKSSLTTSTGSNNPFQYVLKLHSNHNHHNHSSINSSSSHSSYPYPPPSPPSPLSQILTTLTFQTIPQQTLHQLFCTLISQKLTTKCNLQQIERQKMGHRQLLKVLQQSMGYFILLLQSLMLNNSNLTKTYLLIKLQQQLLRQSQTSSFMQSTYALTIVQMIQSYFIQQFKTHTNQYSPGQNYFLFQQKYQKLKNYIKLSAQNKLSFWKQTNKEQPLQKKLKQCITKNYLFQMKILKHTHKIINSYHTSPLILLTLVQSYAQLALNTNMSSSKNIFNFLAVEFHKLYNQNKSKYFNNINNNNNHIKTNQLKDQLKDNQSKYGNNGTLNNFTNISTIKDNHTIGTKSYKLQNNLYVQLQNNPSSHLQKQNIHPIEKYEQTNYNKYAIEKSIGVFLINLQSQQYKIQWANQYFWENYTYHGKTEESSSQDDKDKDKDNKDKQEQKDIKLNDFIIPQLRIVHDKYVHDFIHQGASLAYKHKQTELYFPDDQTFINVKMEFQFLPSLAEGLKMMGFVHPAKGIKKDLVQIMIRSDLTFVACTKSFMDHYDEYSLVKDHLNFEKDKALAFDIIMQNNIFGEFFNNIRLKQSGYGRKKQQKVQEKQQQQDLQSRITHLGMDYVVKLKKKIQYQGKNRDGMKQSQLDTKKHLLVFELETEESMMTTSKTEVLTMEEKQFVSTPMKKSPTHKGSLQPMAESLFIQQDKIDQSPRSLRGSQSTFFKGSQSTLFKGSQTLRSGRTSPKDQHDDIIMEDILIKEREKIQDKPLQIINLQKCYEILVSQRTPNNVKKWRIFTVIVLVLLMGAMVCNMAFLTQRQNLYEQNKDLAINYSSLIADLSATVTAIREYNFYVATYSTDRPEIPFLVKKLFQLSDLISKKVKLLASVLKKAWMAYEILPTGATIDVQDTSYVVISNYLLSSVTFTSQLPASNMSFPILVEEMYASEETPTPAQISFLEAVFNGLYVAIPNLLVDRKQFIHEMIDNLLSTSGMYFIYTCIGGASCLFVFFTLSLLLQLRSQGIRSQTGGLLSSHIISGQQKSKKIERLQKLGEILQNSKGETVVVPDWQDEQAKYKYLDILACTLKDMDHRDQQIHHQQQQGQSDIELNAIISKQQIIDDKTNREFMDNEESLKSSQVSSSVDGDRLSQQHTQKGMKKGDMESIETLQKSKNNKPRKSNFNRYKNEKGGNFQLYTITFKQRSLLIIFYLIVCIPFLGYFISILVGSMSMNSKITNHITITSQVYNRKSYQEIVYLLTRETAYFETFLVQKVGDWNKYLMAMIDETYDRGRKVEKLIMEQKTATNLQNKLDQLNHNNLCQKLSQFSTSTYYNITFTKQECEIIGYNIMTQGYKQLVVSLLQTSLQLNKNYPNPANLTISQRIDYLQNTQLRRMKGLLAYSEQFVQQLVSASLVDLQVQIQQLRQLSILLSMISIFSLILFLVVVRYRYQKLVLQRRQVQSIISLISIQTISDSLNPNQKQKTQNNQLIKMVQKIDWMFYQ